ncbi:DNA-binding transcriptional regulator, ArsR family [Lihuaxuella thermophila]|uniref:DNA-binding transcriptional regulator, ArsR family n=1 Tax=Lihuaxuella thermophila TaxID=1173111 RepID=A0A1H8ICQ7_9BACL|nr:metalloregulator ArsR/SmtB family transcription factor [Lihuaxuella thermophila]SEN65955.1 DNA-binding transcriptional regulator, ArsR family [Lihuaxuella thermophila]
MNKDKHIHLPDRVVEEAVSIFKALADPTRLRILYLLAEEECSVGHIAEVLELSQSAVSHQLALLRSLRLVKARRQGRTVFYTCQDEHVVRLLHQTMDHVQHD